ncbi:MAG: hypothetical protein ABI427_14815 [Solirubrobacteraceae bacterium]
MALIWARALGCRQIAATQRRPLVVNNDPREHGQPSWTSSACRRCAQRVWSSVSDLRSRVLSRRYYVFWWRPRVGKQLAREEHHEPSRVKAVCLGSLAVALQGAGLAGIGEPDLDSARLQFTRDPSPAGRRLNRDDVELAVPLLDPRDKLLSRGLQALLGEDLAVVGVKHSGLKDRLVNIDRGQHDASRQGR